PPRTPPAPSTGAPRLRAEPRAGPGREDRCRGRLAHGGRSRGLRLTAAARRGSHRLAAARGSLRPGVVAAARTELPLRRHPPLALLAMLAHVMSAAGAVFEVMAQHRAARGADAGRLLAEVDDARHLLERGAALE